MVQRVLAALAGLLASSGKPQSAWDHHWLSPQDRARSALAMIGHHTKDAPEKLAVITLATWAWLGSQHALDDGRSTEYRLTQIGKASKRLASGQHQTRGGAPIPSKYPPSSGSYLRIMGRQIDDVAGLLAERAWPEVLALVMQDRERRTVIGINHRTILIPPAGSPMHDRPEFRPHAHTRRRLGRSR